MTTVTPAFNPNAIERTLLRLESAPFHALYRVLIGLLILPAHNALWPADATAWSLPLVALVVLGMLRVIPALARKVIPFSAETRMVWSERRLMGKRYDSYQWQKVFWIGLGLATWIALTGAVTAPAVAIAAVCLLGGSVGMLRWRSASSQPGPRQSRASEAV
jgi:hypothetical protein